MRVFGSTKKHYWSILFHATISFFGLTVLILRSRLIDKLFDVVLVISPTTPVGQIWAKPNAKIKIELHMFNWTNPSDFKNTSVKPAFTEMGPYIYFETIQRVNLSYNKNFTVTYRNNKTFFFVPELSNGTKDDIVTHLNVIPWIGADMARKWNFIFRNGLAIALSDVPYSIAQPVQETIFEGYDSALLNTASVLPFLDVPNMDKFAWFYRRNSSAEYEGVFNVGTGEGNTTLGTMYRWNYNERGPYPGKCGVIQSSFGEMYPQRVTKDKLKFFLPDFCKIVAFDYNDTVFWNGIEGYKFISSTSFLDSGQYYPENSCVCSKKCPKFGVFDFSSCKYGISAYLSLPHFLYADSSYREQVEGMAPNESEHLGYIIVNPRTGVVLDTSINVQMNVFIEPNPKIRKYEDAPTVMMPVFWFKVLTSLPPNAEQLLKILLYLPLILTTTSIFFIVLGVVLNYRTFQAIRRDKLQRDEKFDQKSKDSLKLLKTKDNSYENSNCD